MTRGEQEEEVRAATADALTPKEVAALVGVHELTLSRWRKAGRGPEWVRVGGRYKYPRESLLAWIKTSR